VSAGACALEIVRARVTPVRLALSTPLATATGGIATRDGWVIELHAEHGASRREQRCGFGEALPLPNFGGEEFGACALALERGLRAVVEAPAPSRADSDSDLDSLLDRAAEAVDPARHPIAACAIELALLDLVSRAREVSISYLLGAGDATPIPVSALLSGGDSIALGESTRRAVAAGFRCVKLKLGAGALSEDIARVSAVRAAMGDGVALRLDANGAWSEGEALEAVGALARFEVELLEQPVAAAELDALARVAERANFPIAADESLARHGACDQLLRARAVAAFVLKLPVLGGARAARSIAARARGRGIDVLVTSFLDSSLGLHGAAQLAISLGNAQRAAGLATGALLRRDLGGSLPILNGQLTAPATPGLGVVPNASALAALTCDAVREFGR
jgi:o-succinylbenzoate synthase